MNSTDPIPVEVKVTSISGDNVMYFTGTGTYCCDSRGVHLNYIAADREGHDISSALHLGAGKALADNGSYRLLLDPAHPTVARIDGNAGIHLTVTTLRVHDGTSRGAGLIDLHYTLSVKEQILQEMQVTLALRPMEES